MTPAERDTLADIRDMAEAHAQTPNAPGCARPMGYILERIDNLLDGCPLADPGLSAEPSGILVHRCEVGHHWTAYTYVDRCPTCQKSTFDVHARYSPHTRCTPCKAVGL